MNGQPSASRRMTSRALGRKRSRHRFDDLANVLPIEGRQFQMQVGPQLCAIKVDQSRRLGGRPRRQRRAETPHFVTSGRVVSASGCRPIGNHRVTPGLVVPRVPSASRNKAKGSQTAGFTKCFRAFGRFICTWQNMGQFGQGCARRFGCVSEVPQLDGHKSRIFVRSLDHFMCDAIEQLEWPLSNQFGRLASQNTKTGKRSASRNFVEQS